MLSAYDRVRVRRFGLPGNEVVGVSETELDIDSHSAKISLTVFRHGPDGRWDRFFEEHRNRCFFRQDLARLLEGAGLVPHRWASGHSYGPVTLETWHLVAVCRKERSPNCE